MTKDIILGTIAILVSASAYLIGSGVFGEWGSYMWIAPLPILLFAMHTDYYLRAAIVALLGYFLGNAIAMGYLVNIMPSSLVHYYPRYYFLFAITVDAIFFASFVLITRFAVFRLNHWMTIFIFPCLWTTYEYIGSLVSDIATYNSIANTQVDWLSIIQIASLTGIWGITFLVTLIPASIAIAWHLRNINLQSFISLIVPASLLFAATSWGFWQIKNENYIPSMIVGLANVPTSMQNLQSTDPKVVMDIVDNYIDAAQELADEGATIVLMPEKIVTAEPSYLPSIVQRFTTIAKQKSITIIVGLNEPIASQNVALVIGPDGKIKFEYAKQRLLQWSGEKNYKSGKKPCVFFEDTDKIGVSICHDMDFQTLGRTYSQEKVGVVFVPAMDFYADAWLHARVSILRGIEGGFSVVRNAQWGLMSISDPQGQVTQLRKASLKTPNILLGTVSPGHGTTIYSRLGNWLPWLCIAVLAFIMFRAWRHPESIEQLTARDKEEEDKEEE